MNGGEQVKRMVQWLRQAKHDWQEIIATGALASDLAGGRQQHASQSKKKTPMA